MTSIPDVLQALSERRVRYLLIGGYASVIHGVPRTTLDLDLALDPNEENVGRAVDALAALRLVPDTDRLDEILGQGGVTASNDLEVDLLTSLAGGIAFSDLWARRAGVEFRGIAFPVVSRKDQVALLKASGRPQDLEDAAVLEASDEQA